MVAVDVYIYLTVHCVPWQVHKIEWRNTELHEYGFNFLFDKFKDFYLREIFPDFKTINIYEPDLGNDIK